MPWRSLWLAEVVATAGLILVIFGLAGVFPENTASLTLHERNGFRRVGTRERLGRHHGHWRDVVLLERRSAAIT